MKTRFPIPLFLASLACLSPVATVAAQAGATQDVATAEQTTTETRPQTPKLQEETSPKAPPSIEELIRKIATSTRSKEAPKELRSFQARLLLQHRSPEGALIALRPNIEFQSPWSMRVRIETNKNEIIYVRHKTKLWMKNKGQVYSLGGKKEYERDRQQASQYFEIARTVKRLLYPDMVLEEMQDKKGPFPLDWRLSMRSKPKPALRISGRSLEDEGFPLIQAPDSHGPQGLVLFLDRKSMMPIAYRHFPVKQGPKGEWKRSGQVEELVFLRQQRISGITFPTRWIQRVQNKKTGKLHVIQEMTLLDFRVNPSFSKETFRRPKG